MPLVRPSTTALGVPPLTVAVRAPGELVTVYAVTAEPLSGDAVHETRADRSPPTATTPAAASGTPTSSPLPPLSPPPGTTSCAVNGSAITRPA